MQTLVPTPGKLSTLAVCIILSLTLTACGSDSDDSPTTVVSDSGSELPTDENPTDNNENDPAVNGVITRTIDATAGGIGAAADDPANQWTYYDLDSDSVVNLSDNDAESSTEWDIAFKRTAIRLNGGVSGPGNVTGALAVEPEGFYDASTSPVVDRFINSTADSELGSLSSDVDTTTLNYVSDRLVPDIDGSGTDAEASWWIYDPQAFSVNPNSNAWYIVRGAQGASYAKFHITNIEQSTREITAELFLQPTGTAGFDTNPVTWVAAIGEAGGISCFDIDQAGEVDCASNDASWDLQIEVTADGRSWNIWTNSGVVGSGGGGGSFGVLSDQSQQAFTSNVGIPFFSRDSSGGIFTDSSWYAYDLQENNRIWPSYRVYAINTGTQTYKLQVIGYYDQAGVSGNITMRYTQ
jgi:hypothetical protein